jgi:hypothetical protein
MQYIIRGSISLILLQYVIFNSHMLTLRGSTLKKMLPYKNFYFKWGQYTCGAPQRLTAFGARTFYCYHNKNGSQSTVDKTVELRWVVYRVAEPISFTQFESILKLSAVKCRHGKINAIDYQRSMCATFTKRIDRVFEFSTHYGANIQYCTCVELSNATFYIIMATSMA